MADLRLDPATLRAEGDRLVALDRGRRRREDIESYAETIWTYFNTEPIAECSLVDHVQAVIFARECTFPEAVAACMKARREGGDG